MSASGLTERVAAWRERGAIEEFRDRGIFVQTRATRSDAPGPAIIYLHGFPSSSYDFRYLIERFADRPSIAFDFLGFGLSEKPPDHVYSLLWQADLVEELIARLAGERDVFMCAHDMGTSVATELLARDIEGRLGFELVGALLFNGSVVVERASLTWVQRLLRSRAGPFAARLTSERLFRRQFARLFSDQQPLSPTEAADQWSLIAYNDGHRLGDRLIRYISERTEHAERWHGAVRDWEGPLQLAWGLEDPVATTAVLDALRELRPGVPVNELTGLGHYPQIEAPERIAAALREALEASL